MKVTLPVIKETHTRGIFSIENIPDIEKCETIDFGIQIDEFGKVWICINGIAFIRFKPLKNKLNIVNKSVYELSLAMKELTDDERKEVMSNFCPYCGCDILPCYCMRDD